MKPYLAFMAAAALALSASCGLFKWERSATSGAPPPDIPAADGVVGARLLDRFTTPTITRNGSTLAVSTPEGFTAAIDLRTMIDIDNGFAPIGDDPEMDWIAEMMQANVEGLFEMGYYDSHRHEITQLLIDQALGRFQIARPIRIEVPGGSRPEVVKTFVFSGDRLVVILTGGWIYGEWGMGVDYASSLKDLPSVRELYPALTRQGGYRAASLHFPGFSKQSVSPAEFKRVILPSRRPYGGDLPFLWCRPGSEPYGVSPTGKVYRYAMPYRIQDLASLPLERQIPAELSEIGQYEAGAEDFAGLRKF